MFDIYHKLTEEEAKLVQDVFDAKNDLKRLRDTRSIYQKDLEMLQENDKGKIGAVIVAAIPAAFFWFFFFGDLMVVLIGQMSSMLIGIVFASAAPVMAIVSTIFFFVFLHKHLLIYSKNERYIQKAKKANVLNNEAYRREISLKYTDVSAKVADAEAHLQALEAELEKVEEMSRLAEDGTTDIKDGSRDKIEIKEELKDNNKTKIKENGNEQPKK